MNGIKKGRLWFPGLLPLGLAAIMVWSFGLVPGSLSQVNAATTAISFGESLSASIQPAGDVDTYSFSAIAGDAIFIRMSQGTEALNPQVKLFDPSGVELAGNWGLDTAEVNCIIAEDGNYQIEASDYYGENAGDYGIFVQRLNQAGHATSVKIGDTASYSIGTTGDVYTYTFQGGAGDSISLNVNRTSGALYPEVRLYSPEGTRLIRDWGNKAVEVSPTLPEAGEYVVLVDDYWGNGTGSFDFTVNLLTSGPPPATTPTPMPTPTVTPTPTPTLTTPIISPRPTVYSTYTITPPKIDGMMSSNEWQGEPLHKTLSYVNQGVTETHEMTSYFMHDDNYLYVAVTITNEDVESVAGEYPNIDVLELYFDNNNNGVLEENEDIHNFWNLEYGDWHYSGNGSWSRDQQQDGTGAATHSNQGVGDYIYEFKIPLDSGDTQDLSLTPKDSVGIKILYREMHYDPTSQMYIWDKAEDGWPTADGRFDGATYGVLVLSAGKATPTPPPATPGKPFTYTINDPSGDVSHDFIDITQGTVTIDSSNIIAKIKLANIPAQLLFGNEATPENMMEYEWALFIDTDNNPLTGSTSGQPAVKGCEYSISLTEFKIPSSNSGKQRYDSIINGTQHNIWRYDPSTNGWTIGGDIQAEVDYNTNTLTLTAPLNEAISASSKFYFETFYYDGNSQESDTAPNLKPSSTAPQPAAGKDFGDSIPLPNQISTDPQVIGTNILWALVTILLFYLGATIFNSTVKENYATIQGWLQRASKAWRFLNPSGLDEGLERNKITAKGYIQGILIVAICALIYWFLNPYFTNSLKGIALYASLALGIAIATFSYDGTQLLVSRHAGVRAYIRIFPMAILIAIVCVALSHAIHFRPGLIFGFVGAYTAVTSSGMSAESQDKKDVKQRAKAILWGISVVLVVSFAAFYLRKLLYVTAWREGDFWRYLVEDILVATFAIGLEGLVFSLVPLDFLEGKKVFDWHRWVWLITAAITTFAFYHIIINPDKKLADSIKDANRYIVLAVVIIFLIVSSIIWLYFKRRKKTLPQEAGPSPALPETAKTEAGEGTELSGMKPPDIVKITGGAAEQSMISPESTGAPEKKAETPPPSPENEQRNGRENPPTG